MFDMEAYVNISGWLCWKFQLLKPSITAPPSRQPLYSSMLPINKQTLAHILKPREYETNAKTITYHDILSTDSRINKHWQWQITSVMFLRSFAYINTQGSTAPLMVCVYMYLISRHLIQFMAAVILHSVWAGWSSDWIPEEIRYFSLPQNVQTAF